MSEGMARCGSYSLVVKQSWHWHDKRFTPWHAIWRATVPVRKELVTVTMCVETRLDGDRVK